jgi:parallel beta-helix repeat protein
VISPPQVARAVTHSNIVIKSNQDFVSCNCVTSGDGSPSNPYVISGLAIYTSSAPGILVDNSNGKITKYFEITGDTVNGGNGQPTSYPGAEFIDVTGLGKIVGTGNTFNGNEYGIYLKDSWNILIDGGNTNNGATANNNGIAGIAIVGGGGNTIENIQVNKNGIGIPENFQSGGRGIELNDTNGNILNNVILSEDSQAGLSMFSSSNNIIDDIIIHYPDFYATVVDGGSGNILENSVFQTADYVGLWLRDHTSNNMINSDQFLGNGPVGREKSAGIVPYFTVGLYLSSGAGANNVENNFFNQGNSGGSIILDNGTIINIVQKPVQSNNAFNDPKTGNEPSSPVFPSGPSGSGNYFCGNSIYATQGGVVNYPTC